MFLYVLHLYIFGLLWLARQKLASSQTLSSPAFIPKLTITPPSHLSFLEESKSWTETRKDTYMYNEWIRAEILASFLDSANLSIACSMLMHGESLWMRLLKFYFTVPMYHNAHCPNIALITYSNVQLQYWDKEHYPALECMTSTLIVLYSLWSACVFWMRVQQFPPFPAFIGCTLFTQTELFK